MRSATLPRPGRRAWVQLEQRLQDEQPLVEPRVRPSAPARRPPVAVEEQVEVDRARALARPFAGAAELALDLEQAVEQLARGLSPFDLGDRVQEARLVLEPQGSVSRIDESRCGPDALQPRRIAASRSPRFAPSPTKARVTVLSLSLTHL